MRSYVFAPLCASLLFAGGSILAAKGEEPADSTELDGLVDLASSEVSHAFSQISALAGAAGQPPTPAAPVTPAGNRADLVRSVTIGARLAELGAASRTKDVPTLKKAIGELAALHTGKLNPRAVAMRERALAAARAGRWDEVDMIVKHIRGGRMTELRNTQGADAATLAALGMWLRFLEFGSTARCASGQAAPGPLVKPIPTEHLRGRLASLSAAPRSQPFAAKALAQFEELAALAQPPPPRTPSAEDACRAKTLVRGLFEALR